MREYLEKNYNADSMKDKELVIKLAVKALLEVNVMVVMFGDCASMCMHACSVSFMSWCCAVPQVVQSGSQSIEMAVLEKGKRLKVWAWNVWCRVSAVLRCGLGMCGGGSQLF